MKRVTIRTVLQTGHIGISPEGPKEILQLAIFSQTIETAVQYHQKEQIQVTFSIEMFSISIYCS